MKLTKQKLLEHEAHGMSQNIDNTGIKVRDQSSRGNDPGSSNKGSNSDSRNWSRTDGLLRAGKPHKCYKCGDIDYHKCKCKRGPRCYVCNTKGHIARDCKEKKALNDKKASTAQADNNDNSIYCDVIMEGIKVRALVDTGAGISLISRKLLQ